MSADLRDARRHPVWWDLHDTAAITEAYEGHTEADLVVIGAGLTGLWAAIEAVIESPGRRVVVLEQDVVAAGASGRNGGFISDSLTHGLAHGEQMWPQEMPTLLRLGRGNLDHIARFLATEGIDADLRRCGKTVVATRPHEVVALRKSQQLHRRHGEDAEFLDAAQMRADVDSPTYLAGLRIRSGGGLVDPLALTLGLRDAALRRGVILHERSPVTRIDGGAAGAPGVRVQTERGTVQARQVFLATNAYPSLLRRLRLFTVPVWDHVIATEPLSQEQLDSIGWTESQGLTDAGNQFHYYRRTPDGRILFGGYDANYYFGSNRDPRLEHTPSHDLLVTHFRATFPQLQELAITHRWGGMIDTSARFVAFTGTALSGRVAYALGFTGLGVAASRFAALTALDRLAGRRTQRTELAVMRQRPVPFPPEPVRWAGVQLTRSALAREDVAGRRGPLLRLLDSLGIGFNS